jgi:hypothetical protein
LLVDEAVAVPLEAGLPEDAPVAEPDVGVEVGAGDAASNDHELDVRNEGTDPRYTLPEALTSKLELCESTRV